MIREFSVRGRLGDPAVDWLAGRRPTPSPPKASATTVLVRDGAPGSGPGGIELFMMRRHTTMAFAAGMYVFPGGGVDPRDADPDLPWAGPTPQEWADRLGTDPAVARGLVCAAARETFEECGVILAGPDAHTVAADVSDDTWEADRQALLAREIPFAGLLQRRGLVLRSDLLRPWAHWTTPEFEPRRFDTRFLLATLPAGQTARHVEDGEASESGWWPSGQILAAHHDGTVNLLPPTLVTIEGVAAARTVEDLLATPRTIRPVMPWLEGDPTDARIVADLPT